MNPSIPTRPCVACGRITNETHSVIGVAHHACFKGVRMNWLPIDTAPKDGTRVFLFLPKIDGVQNKSVLVSSWMDCLQCWGNEYDNGPAYNCIFVQHKHGKELKHEHIQPSHWAPIQEPTN